ncbi:MAG: adenylate/guanylate cyclase protein [Actinomycetia bacterium]|nr:adenylate/guanylate cyclase protein [Actinomycetes bacterium]
MPGDTLTEEEVAERAGTTVQRVRELAALGLLGSDDGTMRRRDVLLARVIGELTATGIQAQDLAAALEAGELSFAHLESAGRRHPRADTTFEQLANEIGVDFQTLEAVFIAFGLPQPRREERVRHEDLQGLKTLPVLLGAGVSEGHVLQMARVWGDSARRVAQYQAHFMHAVIEEPFRRRGLRDNEAVEAAFREVGVHAGRSGEDLLGWLYRRHSETFTMEHQFSHVETALERAGVRPKPTPNPEAAAFADLTGYTTLTEEAGDVAATDVALALSQLVKEMAIQHRGEVVKMLGDGVHFHFRDPHDAVRASLDIVGQVRTRGLPPAHVGVNAGPMIYEEGDYFGRTVNIAARIAAEAGADQVFVGEDLARAVEPRGFALRELGAFELKGVTRQITVYEAMDVETG